MGVRDAFKALFQNTTPKERPANGEVGFTGNKIFSGLPMDEYNPDLAFPISTQVYDQMRKSDGQIAAVLAAITLPIRSTKWYIQQDPDADDQDLAEQIADFVSDNLFGGMKFSWDDHLREALLMLVYGFSVFETVWRFDNWQGRPVVMLDKYAPRIASSIWRFPQDDDYNIAAVQQINYMTGQIVDIPLDKCRVYTFQREGDNIAGISILRPAYKHWYIKDALYRIVAVGIEKTAIGTPFAELPDDLSDDDRQKILNVLSAIRTAEDGGLTVPKGVTLGILEGRKSPIDAMPFIEHHDTMIGRSVLAQFLNLGTMSSASGGSYALGREMVDLFVMYLEAIANYIQGEVQKDVEKLVRWNFGDDAPMPTLEHKDISFRDMSQVAQSLYWLGAGHLLQVDEDVEDHIRDMFGLPPIPADALRNQQPGVVTSPNYNTTIIPTQPGVEIPVPAAPPQPAKPAGKAAKQAAGTAAAQAAQQSSRAAMHEMVHTFTEGKTCSCGHVHRFDDATGGEIGEPAGTTKWRRDLTYWEKKVKLDDINDAWDTAETKLLANMQSVMNQASAAMAKQIADIANDNSKTMNQKLQAINALQMKYSGKYEATMKSQMLELFQFGQSSVADELGIDASQIPNSSADQATLNARAAALTDLQMQKLASAMKLAAISALGRNAAAKEINYAMSQAAAGYIQGPDLKASATITVGDAINTGRGTVSRSAGIQGAQWSAVLDEKTCPLCEELDGHTISVDNPDFDVFQPPIHQGCRCFYIYIGSDETNVEFDWETPSGSMTKKYGHLIV